MIHTYPKRLWYVEEYLIPSMLKQGIQRAQIKVYNDDIKEGNLKACMRAFAKVRNDDGHTWHLQDDVCICKDFKKRTEKIDKEFDGIVCGFSTARYNRDVPAGKVKLRLMWFSFPCIRIPNKIAIECSNWVLMYMIGNPCYVGFWKDGVNDDWCFKQFLQTYYQDIDVWNLNPNLVDHIDYLIGGGSGGKRDCQVRAQYWEDESIVEELANALDNNKTR